MYDHVSYRYAVDLSNEGTLPCTDPIQLTPNGYYHDISLSTVRKGGGEDEMVIGCVFSIRKIACLSLVILDVLPLQLLLSISFQLIHFNLSFSFICLTQQVLTHTLCLVYYHVSTFLELPLDFVPPIGFTATASTGEVVMVIFELFLY